MKRKLLLLCAVMSALGLTTSCSDKTEETVVNYTMNIYGLSYPMTSGALWESTINIVSSKAEYIYYDRYENEDGIEVVDEVVGFKMGDKTISTGNFILSLYGEGLSYNTELNEVKGTGACISFHLASEDAEKLKDGTYTYSTTKNPFTFTAFSSAKFDMSGIDEKPAKIISGEVTVSSASDGAYTVKYDCEISSGAKVNGTYSGILHQNKIAKSPLSISNDVMINGLQDEILLIESIEGDIYETPMLDDSTDPALYACAENATKLMSSAVTDNVDIAVYYNKDANELLLQSPIVMRKYLGHDAAYNIPGHTEFMYAPSTFTDADFENFSVDDLNFNIEDTPISFQLDNFAPAYIFFKSGTGISGVLKVKSFNPLEQITKILIAGYWTQTWNLAPSLVMDVKCKADFKDADIR